MKGEFFIKNKAAQNKKIYVLDTSVLTQNANALFLFDDNDIIIPDIVLDELSKYEDYQNDIGKNTREVLQMLTILLDSGKGDSANGYPLGNDGFLRIETNCTNVEMPKAWNNDATLRILRVCKGLKEHNPDKKVILVSNKSSLRAKANVIGLEQQPFSAERSPELNELYKGRVKLYVSSKVIDSIYKEKLNTKDILFFDESGENNNYEFSENEYIHLSSLDNIQQSILCIYKKGEISQISHNSTGVIKGQNNGQKFILNAINENSEDSPLVIIRGSAGTGKTLLAISSGLNLVEEKKYRKILYLRSTKIEGDEDIGFLPGSEGDKLSWMLRPVRDNLEVIIRSKNKNILMDEDAIKSKCDFYFEKEIINIESVGFMRGRSLANMFIIIDEAQNLTPKQIKTLLSRLSNDSKMILIGDPEQIDNPRLDYRNNGLCYAVDRMKGSLLTHQISLNADECKRSELSSEISQRMNDI